MSREIGTALVVLVAVIITRSAIAGERSTEERPNMMEIVLFLNANMLPAGAARSEIDWEHKSVKYFDAAGRLMEDHRLTPENVIMSRKFDAAGRVISETKLTESGIQKSMKWAQNDHEQNIVPKLKTILQTLSTAAERYAKDHQGRYPQRMQQLTGAQPPYLNACICHNVFNMYLIECDLRGPGYRFAARAIWSQEESYVISTGGQFSTKPPGELNAPIPYPPSPSPCEGSSAPSRN